MRRERNRGAQGETTLKKDRRKKRSLDVRQRSGKTEITSGAKHRKNSYISVVPDGTELRDHERKNGRGSSPFICRGHCRNVRAASVERRWYRDQEMVVFFIVLVEGTWVPCVLKRIQERKEVRDVGVERTGGSSEVPWGWQWVTCRIRTSEGTDGKRRDSPFPNQELLLILLFVCLFFVSYFWDGWGAA